MPQFYATHNAPAAIESVQNVFNSWEDYIASRTREIGILAMERLHEGSPIDRGEYRAGHDLSIGAPSGFAPPVLPRTSGSRGAPLPEYVSMWDSQMSKARATLATIIRLPPVMNIYVTNNVGHARLLEDGGSAQKPSPIYGIVKVFLEQTVQGTAFGSMTTFRTN